MAHEFSICSRCGLIRGAHLSLNYSDGQHVTREVLVCPTAVFKEAACLTCGVGDLEYGLETEAGWYCAACAQVRALKEGDA